VNAQFSILSLHSHLAIFALLCTCCLQIFPCAKNSNIMGIPRRLLLTVAWIVRWVRPRVREWYLFKNEAITFSEPHWSSPKPYVGKILIEPSVRSWGAIECKLLIFTRTRISLRLAWSVLLYALTQFIALCTPRFRPFWVLYKRCFNGMLVFYFLIELACTWPSYSVYKTRFTSLLRLTPIHRAPRRDRFSIVVKGRV